MKKLPLALCQLQHKCADGCVHIRQWTMCSSPLPEPSNKRSSNVRLSSSKIIYEPSQNNTSYILHHSTSIQTLWTNSTLCDQITKLTCFNDAVHQPKASRQKLFSYPYSFFHQIRTRPFAIKQTDLYILQRRPFFFLPLLLKYCLEQGSGYFLIRNFLQQPSRLWESLHFFLVWVQPLDPKAEKFST